MPRELPGMYWDDEKKRYFPLSSRLAGTTSAMEPPSRPQQTPSTVSRSKETVSRKRKFFNRDSKSSSDSLSRDKPISSGISHWRTHNTFREFQPNGRRRRYLQKMQMEILSSGAIESDLSDLNGRFPLDVGETVSALCTRGDVDGGNIWIGDGAGWLYTMDTREPDHRWREFFLGTPITSISRSGPITLVTSFGSPSRALVTRSQTIGLWLLREFPPNLCDDVRCGKVIDHRVVVGGKGGALCFLDAERDQYNRLRSESDVFSLCFQNQNLLFLGMRNGVIERWDLRQPKIGPDVIVNMSKEGERSGVAPVQHLHAIHGHGLLIETMRGDLEVHDLRYLHNATPLLQLGGHVSSYKQRLGLTIEPGENFLFVGGEDARLRAWSLRTGRALHSDIASLQTTPGSNPFHAAYSHPIQTMEIVPNDEKTLLWMGSHTHLHRIELGPSGILR
ncbi:hypothetical protein C8Q79DRAFT_533086 [Trametes meyenii]|nr:hypothetical protein C8Q79DRAFT_533086 [Trametes meyenii]